MKKASTAVLEKTHMTLLGVVIVGVAAKVWEAKSSPYGIITFYQMSIWGYLFLASLSIGVVLASYLYLQNRMNHNFLKYMVLPGIAATTLGYALKTYVANVEIDTELMYIGIGAIVMFESLSHIKRRKKEVLI